MKIENYQDLADLWKTFKKNYTPDTAVDVEVHEKSIELVPAKDNFGDTFYKCEELVDFCRTFKLSCWISYDFDKKRIYAHITGLKP